MTSSTPIPRRIPRREVLAFLALNGEELHMPSETWFREYAYEGDEWRVITLTVDSDAAVRFWAQILGHSEHGYRTHTGETVTAYASSGDWRGWRTEVACRIRIDAPPESSPKVSDEARLRELAGGDQ